jgi:hypothetical protein
MHSPRAGDPADTGRITLDQVFSVTPTSIQSRGSNSRIAIALAAGLFVGFASGYLFGTWGDSADQVTASRGEAPPGQPSATDTAGRPWSETAVVEEPAASAAGQTGSSGRVPPPLPPAAKETPARTGTAVSPPASAIGARAAPAAAPSTRGVLQVRSTPSGARVTVNGRARGSTPLVLKDLPYGNYTVRIVQRGYDPLEARVAVSADRPSANMEVALTRPAPKAAPKPAAKSVATAPAKTAGAATRFGMLAIDSLPRGARVFVDGRQLGKTPMVARQVLPGSHEVRLELPGYLPWSSRVDVSLGGETRVAGSLERSR